MNTRTPGRRALLCALTATLIAGTAAQAANHSDAPLIKLDPQVNLTDTYAFVGTQSNDPSVRVLNVVVQVRPFSEPGDGAIFDRFSPDARYSIVITHPATGKPLRRYDFRYSSVTSGYKRTNTILSYGQANALLGLGGQIENVNDANHNYTQTYTVSRVQWNVEGGPDVTTVLARDLLTPPPNVGNRVTPYYNDVTGRAQSGASSFAGLDRYTQQTIYNLPSGETVWSGHREDGFYSDIPGIFNLVDPRVLLPGAVGLPGGQPPLVPGSPTVVGTDGFRGFNVLVFAIQIPLADLPALPYNVVNNASLFGPATQRGVGVYAATFRPQTTLAYDDKNREASGAFQRSSGPFIQVSRLGNPIFAEGLIALRDKDNFNRTFPPGDSRYATYALNSEVARIVNRLYGVQGISLGLLFQETNRADLRTIFIPEVLRVNTQTEPVRLAGQLGFNRLSTFGGDRTADGTPGGWPNGRRLGDDVTDIFLTLTANGPNYLPLTIPIGDSAVANDQLFHQVFPYAATPNAGARNSKDSGVNLAQ